MSVKEYYKSEQFQWALDQAAWMFFLGLIPLIVGILSGALGWSEFGIASLGVLAPILKRLHEGKVDALRAEQGDILTRDVSFEDTGTFILN